MTTPATGPFEQGIAPAARVEKKRLMHMGKLQDEHFYLEAALEAAYEELERRATRIADLEAQLAPADEVTA